MRLSNTYKFENRQIMTGLFSNRIDVYQAQEILTDFGYPKEASSKIELKAKSRKVKARSKKVFLQIKDKVILGISIGAVLILGALLTGGHLYSTLNFSEIGILLTVWLLLLIVSTVICGFIGVLVAVLLSSPLTEQFGTAYNDEIENGDVLLSVAVKTPVDAQDIAREWTQIGGRVV